MSDTASLLNVALGRSPELEILKPKAERLALSFTEMPTINRAFMPMVRELRYDISELAIATFLQAKAYGKPLVLLPVVVAQRFQQMAFLCRADSDITASRLAGCRIGARAYSQTTAMWLRGILADDYGIAASEMKWVTFEDAHVAEVEDPQWCQRAPAGSDMMAMLQAGELDAVIVGNVMPDDASLRCVFADIDASVEHFRKIHNFVPVNHMVVVKEEALKTHRDAVMRFFDALRQAQLESGHAARPFGREALRAPVDLARRYAIAQGLLPHAMTEEDVWSGIF